MNIIPTEQDAPLLDHRVKYAVGDEVHYYGYVIGAFWILPMLKQELRYAVRVKLEGGGVTVLVEIPENITSIEKSRVAPGATMTTPGLRKPVSLSEDAKKAGYTGNMCTQCFSFRVKNSGTCTVCEDCGTTSGCS